MFAEEKQITQTGAFALRTTNAFGPQFSGMFVNAVSAVGNFGEMLAANRAVTTYQINLESLIRLAPKFTECCC